MSPVRQRFHEGIVYDTSYQPIQMKNKVLFKVFGNSCEEYGIPDGSDAVMEKYPSTADIKVGHIVIVDAITKKSEVGLRLRKVKATKGTTIQFEKTKKGKKYQDRKPEEVIGYVTYVRLPEQYDEAQYDEVA